MGMSRLMSVKFPSPCMYEVQISCGPVQRAKHPLCFFLEWGQVVFVSQISSLFIFFHPHCGHHVVSTPSEMRHQHACHDSGSFPRKPGNVTHPPPLLLFIFTVQKCLPTGTESMMTLLLPKEQQGMLCSTLLCLEVTPTGYYSAR